MRFWLGLLLTVVVFSLLVKLGFWQLSRGEAKQETELMLSHREEQAPLPLPLALERHRNEPLTGLNVSSYISPLPLVSNVTFLLDNQIYNGKVGYLAYQVVTDGAERFFLLERGFVAGTRQRSLLPDVEWLSKEQNLIGRLYQKSTNPLSTDLGLETTTPFRIQNLNIPEISEQLGFELAPYVFQPKQESWPYPQPWQPLPMLSSKHFGYAVQWFSMALAFGVLCVYVLVRALKVVQDKANVE
ncbi:SURF1 family protein [Vibrio sp. ZSDE26]|uniref:SURF1-like protein n=1 Tax=Vibrio amylolyticus TaxID=2847292 RepID=A0A9X2BK11_9VIBR|nr:SURF1 family protein [Vibrio amylolyticus]MCK6264007.1 SURF1 family protein [Vibrio amylolyticus]